MSLNDSWAQELDDLALSFLYRICNRLIEGDAGVKAYVNLRSKGEQDTAWAIKQEFERRMEAKPSPDHMPGVWLPQEETAPVAETPRRQRPPSPWRPWEYYR